MTATPVILDASGVSRADRIVHKLEESLNILSGMVILALVLMAAVNVLGRKLLNSPLPGFIDWVEQFMAVFAFIGVAYCQRDGGHIRMDMLVRTLRKRMLWAAELLAVALMWMITSVLIYGSWHHFLRSFDVGSPGWSRDSSIDISLPLWPAKLIVPVALGLLWVRLLIQMWGYGRALRLNLEAPAAVPLMLDAAQQARSEAGLGDGGPDLD